MAKIQIVMAITLDGFLPEEDEMLMRWIKEDGRYGFLHWKQKATFQMYPHYTLMDLMDITERHDRACTYFAEIHDMRSARYVRKLFLYNLVDEIVVYMLPLSYGKGTALTDGFQPCKWKLHGFKTLPNDICRFIYRRTVHET